MDDFSKWIETASGERALKLLTKNGCDKELVKDCLILAFTNGEIAQIKKNSDFINKSFSQTDTSSSPA